MYVIAPHPQISGWVQLLRVEGGVAMPVGMFDNEPFAARIRDLLNRHGLVDSDLQIVNMGGEIVGTVPPLISWSP